ncbi:HtaA domain-containing protein [Gordonia terrae]|uniref:HtaA domain-containing protein n=1 Tax=Gordonia terrae TaxID=2055 RepID=UPI003F6C488B
MTAHGLLWGIKHSFVDYIARMPDGQSSISGGARPTESGAIYFEVDTAVTPPTPDGATVFPFRGDVRFGGHFGMLFVRIADPWITRRGAQAELSIRDLDEPETGPRRTLVTFDLADPRHEGDVEIFEASEVRLAPTACDLFNDVYPPRELFEPLAFAVPTAQAVSTV